MVLHVFIVIMVHPFIHSLICLALTEHSHASKLLPAISFCRHAESEFPTVVILVGSISPSLPWAVRRGDVNGQKMVEEAKQSWWLDAKRSSAFLSFLSTTLP